MRVLVWKSYGSIDVIGAEKIEDFQKIAKAVTESMEDWGEDDNLANMNRVVDTIECNNSIRERAIMRVVEDHIRTHETFEDFQFETII